MSRAEVRVAATMAALTTATEKNVKALADEATCATELAALEEELRASARDGQADDLADAVEAALKNPAAAYSHASLQAAFARYTENKKDAESRKDRDKGQRGAPAPAKAAATAPKAVRSPAAKRAPTAAMTAAEARDVASAASGALALALTDGSPMEEDGQGREEEEEDASGNKRFRQAGGLATQEP